MVTDNHDGRALSFGAVAQDYDRFRPGPPREALTWLLPVPGGTALEIGAGTGAFTRLLVGHVSRMIAVEPDRRMGVVLAQRVAGASIVAARAEELPLGDACVAAVVGSSMWHWVDEERAVLEAARVLRPGGVLGLLWSGWDRSEPWLAGLLALAGAGGFRDDEKARHHRHTVHLPPGAPFSAVETHSFPWALTVTPARLRGTGRHLQPLHRPPAGRTEPAPCCVNRRGRHPAGRHQREGDPPLHGLHLLACRSPGLKLASAANRLVGHLADQPGSGVVVAMRRPVRQRLVEVGDQPLDHVVLDHQSATGPLSFIDHQAGVA